MKIIIFAGGSGKRFWPVSKINSAKQFSPLIYGKPLLRVKIDTLLKGFRIEDIFISTGEIYRDEVRKIIPELPKENLIIESEMRDTGPAVTLAIMYVNKLFPNETICTQWSDNIVKNEDLFIETLKQTEQDLSGNFKTIFITVPARFASVHRGYIEFGNKISTNENLLEFIKFREKPTLEVAKEYIAKGNFGWNPGYWVLKADYYIDVVKKHNPTLYKVCSDIVENNFEESFVEEYAKLDKISADYLFAENTDKQNAAITYADFGWSDIGEWMSLKEALEEDSKSNVTKGNVFDMSSEDSIIFNLEEEKLVSTIGLKGMVVVNTKDVVAVFSKADNDKLKEYLTKLSNEGYGQYL